FSVLTRSVDSVRILKRSDRTRSQRDWGIQLHRGGRPHEGGSVTRDIKQRTRWGVGLAVGLALLLALCGASRVRAADDGGADPPKKVRRVKKKKSAMAPMAMATASAADRIEALSGDVDNLRKS